MMRMEVLFPEICNLYGELGNVRLIEQSCPQMEIRETHLTERPLFFSEKPDMIYMGTMSENSQMLVLEKLMPLKERIEELIDDEIVFLITGNALEIFGTAIKDSEEESISCLNIIDTEARRDMAKRYNSLYLGVFGEMDIVGFKSQFSHSYYMEKEENKESPLFVTKRGPGLSPEEKGEGVRKKNFMGTYVTGPLLALNPPFAKFVLSTCGGNDDVSLAFETEAMEAYKKRVEEYSDPKTGFYY